jgi:hypothetical protein
MYYNFDAGAAIFNTVHQIPESNRLDVGVVPMPRDLGETWAKKRRVPQGKRANLPRHVRLAMRLRVWSLAFPSRRLSFAPLRMLFLGSQPSIAFPFRRAGKCLLPDFHGLWARIACRRPWRNATSIATPLIFAIFIRKVVVLAVFGEAGTQMMASVDGLARSDLEGIHGCCKPCWHTALLLSVMWWHRSCLLMIAAVLLTHGALGLPNYEDVHTLSQPPKSKISIFVSTELVPLLSRTS